MNPKKILQSNLLDIVFEHRNKDYGAYPLRKFYNNRLYKALGAVCMLVLLFSLLGFLQPDVKSDISARDIMDSTGLTTPPIDKPLEPKPAPQKPPAAAAPVHNMDAFTAPLIVPDSKVLSKVNSLSDSARLGDHEIKGKPGNTVVVVPPVPPGTGDPVPDPPAVPAVDPGAAIEHPEFMPSFPGGTDALRKFLEKNLENPQDLDVGQSVSVQIKFIVGFDGRLKGFETVQDGGAAFNNEVIRVLKKMPQWIPGKTRGQNVSVYFILPVKFMSTD